MKAREVILGAIAKEMTWWLASENSTGSSAGSLVYDASMNWLYLLLGLLVGMISGVVGTGGGVLIVPALVFLFHMSQREAQGTSLGALLAPIGILAFWEYYKAGQVNVAAALLIALGFAIGGYFGGFWAQHLPEAALRRILGVLMLVIGAQMLLGRK
jgi:uncharacterized protein